MKPKMSKQMVFGVVDVETGSNLAGDTPLVWEIGVALVRGDGLFMGSTKTLVNIQHMMDLGFKMNADTLGWLMSQSEDVRARFTAASKSEAPDLFDALNHINHFIMSQLGLTGLEPVPANFYLMGRGAAFDVPIMETLYRKAGYAMPWKFYNGLCLRTFELLIPIRAKTYGTHHSAEDDAIWEAQCLAKQLQVYWQFADNIIGACRVISDQDEGEERVTREAIDDDYLLAIPKAKEGWEKALSNRNVTSSRQSFAAPYGAARPTGGDPYEGFAYGDSAVCLHQSCPECHGTFKKKDGSTCMHALSCPCPKCSPKC